MIPVETDPEWGGGEESSRGGEFKYDILETL
jgi:hypothetical protein